MTGIPWEREGNREDDQATYREDVHCRNRRGKQSRYRGSEAWRHRDDDSQFNSQRDRSPYTCNADDGRGGEQSRHKDNGVKQRCDLEFTDSQFNSRRVRLPSPYNADGRGNESLNHEDNILNVVKQEPCDLEFTDSPINSRRDKSPSPYETDDNEFNSRTVRLPSPHNTDGRGKEPWKHKDNIVKIKQEQYDLQFTDSPISSRRDKSPSPYETEDNEHNYRTLSLWRQKGNIVKVKQEPCDIQVTDSPNSSRRDKSPSPYETDDDEHNYRTLSLWRSKKKVKQERCNLEHTDSRFNFQTEELHVEDRRTPCNTGAGGKRGRSWEESTNGEAKLQNLHNHAKKPDKPNKAKNKSNSTNAWKKGGCNEVEMDEGRLRTRQRQIDIGKETEGYQIYTKQVERRERTLHHPRTPDKTTKRSTRSWQGMVRVWRRKLHYWDPPGAKEDQELKLVDILASPFMFDEEQREKEKGKTTEDHQIEKLFTNKAVRYFDQSNLQNSSEDNS